MGNAKAARSTQEMLGDLQQRAASLRRSCRAGWAFGGVPNRRVSQAEFGASTSVCSRAAAARASREPRLPLADVSGDGTLDFREYIIALHLTSSGLTSLKLGGRSRSSRGQQRSDHQSGGAGDHRAIFKLIPEEETKDLPEDENTAEKRADKLWSYFGKKEKEKLLEGEFIEGVLENENALRLIQYEPKKK
ncbi:hypothetical protein AOXY_G33758 [Acipenser oxyrinchus oxyrinchus]|uniref:EF-hand domain-containing protein n=1 Tax=Acipenser oxyrinchus oxyrinchus TaxID=40147 RepID=A0AAD8FPM1_ACIOX|nr:hypothetical protein AOXY_G33758 [Acipenser oxyrinchus oxyrinchus]